MKQNRTVFVLNKDGHDFTPAGEFGSIVYITEGALDRFAVSNMYRAVDTAMHDSSEDDLIVVSSLSIVNAIASAYFATLHGRLNLLLFSKGKYIERNLSFD